MLRILSAVWLACIAATQVPAAQGPPKTAFSGTTARYVDGDTLRRCHRGADPGQTTENQSG
jgi:hypothetical protein